MSAEFAPSSYALVKKVTASEHTSERTSKVHADAFKGTANLHVYHKEQTIFSSTEPRPAANSYPVGFHLDGLSTRSRHGHFPGNDQTAFLQRFRIFFFKKSKKTATRLQL